MCEVPQLTDLDLTDIDTVAIDLETYDPNLKTKGLGAIRKDGFVCGIAIATKKQTLYFPIAHNMTDNLNTKETWDYLNEKVFKNKGLRKVFHNAMYDVCWIRSATGEMPQGPLLDTMIAASVIDETRMKYSLDSISKDYLKETKYKYDLTAKVLKWSDGMIKDPMTNMHKLPHHLVKDYAEQDVNLTLKLWQLFDKKLDEVLYTKYDEEGNPVEEKTCRKIFQLETKLFPCLVDMKFKGVKIDVQKAKTFGKWLDKRRDNLIKLIKDRTGVDVQIWAASSIKKLLDQQKITDYKKTKDRTKKLKDKKGKPIINKETGNVKTETIKSIIPKLPKDYLKTHKNRFLRMIVTARECDKAKNTFIEGLLGFVYKGRIHADINQIRSDQGGTVTGRFSMANPNLQQIPAKGMIGKKMRELFIPDDGCVWGSFDYSQQEPRIVVHYALKTYLYSEEKKEVALNLIKSLETIEEAYKEKDVDFHQIVADMAKIPRITAKTINLGLFYGMGKIKLQKELNLTREQANELFATYHATVPFVRQLSRDLIEFAEEHKLLFTLEDRFCRFNKWETQNREWDNTINRYEPVPILTKDGAQKEFKSTLVDIYKEGKIPKDYMKNFDKHYKPAFTYKALNRLIQGSAADMTKRAMVNLYEQGILPQIQIHDELCLSIKNDKEAAVVKNIMENAIPLIVNNKVNYKKGKNWGTIKEK
jgi:DNA polymerase I-like protein with 3'-5' exonuclease and polymerase domains